MNMEELLKELVYLKKHMEDCSMYADNKISENYYAGAANAYDTIIKLLISVE